MDLSKHCLDGFLLPDRSRFRLDNDDAGGAALGERARALIRSGARVLVVVEASGGYERLLHERLRAADVPIAIVTPKRVRASARGIGRLAKTDRVDAEVLARYGLTEQPRPTPRPDPERTALRDLLAYRDQVRVEIAARTPQLSRDRSPALRTRAEPEIVRLTQERGPSGNAGGGTPWPARSLSRLPRARPWRRSPASSAASPASARWSRRRCWPMCPNAVSSTPKPSPVWPGERRSPRTAVSTRGGAPSRGPGQSPLQSLSRRSGRGPPQPHPESVLRSPDQSWQAWKSRPHRLHAKAPGHPEHHGPYQYPLAARSQPPEHRLSPATRQLLRPARQQPQAATSERLNH